MSFCVLNCTSPSQDYAAVACSNSNQAVTYSRISSLQISRGLTRPRVASRYSVRTSSYNSVASYQSVATILACVMNTLTCRKWAWQLKNFRGALRACATPLSKFLDPPLKWMPSQSPGPKPEVASLQSSHMPLGSRYIFLTYSTHGSRHVFR